MPLYSGVTLLIERLVTYQSSSLLPITSAFVLCMMIILLFLLLVLVKLAELWLARLMIRH